MLGWKEYRSSHAPFRSAPGSRDPVSWGGMPCANLPAGDFQVPPPSSGRPMLRPRAARTSGESSRLLAQDSSEDDFSLTEIARQGPGNERLFGVSTRLRTYSLKEADADWLTPLQVDKIPPEIRERVEDKGLYRFSTHKEERRRNRQKLHSVNNKGGRPIATIRAKIAASAKKTPHMTRRAVCLGAPTRASDPAA